MMEKTALGSRSNCVAQAWPNQKPSERRSVAKRIIPQETQPRISFPRPHHRSPHASRSHKASYVLSTSAYIAFLPEIQPRINTHRPRHTPAA
jgi:hypothetical protein